MTPITKVLVDNHTVFIKRDDLKKGILNGNKARKLHQLCHSNIPRDTTIVSLGGIQSNYMLALAKLAYHRQCHFHYYSKPLPTTLKHQPVGNYQTALTLDMQHFEQPASLLNKQDILSAYATQSNQVLWLAQGGKEPSAETGLALLANELIEQMASIDIKRFNVLIPSGTGISAYYLQKHLYPLTVYTVACVGSSSYLQQQIAEMTTDHSIMPTLLTCPDKFPFGKPNQQLLQQYQDLYRQTQIEFDLLYDPIAWITLRAHIDTLTSLPLVYIHCGGTEGNASMLKRYQYIASTNGQS